MPDPYRQLVSDLQRPTEQQTAAFVKFVAGAHSWYKHLPQLAPGSPFIFFLNPDAGKQCIGTQTGETAFVDRVEGDGSEFHYTWMPTATYREKFGDWDYHSGMARTFMVGTPGGGTNTPRELIVFHQTENGRPCPMIWQKSRPAS